MARKKTLTDNMKKFAVSYIANRGNIAETAKQIGLSNKTCYGYLQNELVQQEVDHLMSIVPQEKIRSAVQLREELNNMLDPEYKDEMIDLKGNIRKVKPPLRDRVKAVELLGKFQGAFVQKHEVQQAHFVIDLIEEDEEDDRTIIDADYVEL
ncbi:terminase small subunit [Fictibacillus terranigra]|uniref:Terminase small subunit n=1 Tax=Fictibacillus terranigra TaxID=3058424 RepID=A0ABT8E8S9_9BACL|nr:terminase small subunit [Fictibacillus sp. CENA-BCM004]MDN4074321.1 terminase small subunit [Fictibacillus sp. CENA-BCM004]